MYTKLFQGQPLLRRKLSFFSLVKINLFIPINYFKLLLIGLFRRYLFKTDLVLNTKKNTKKKTVLRTVNINKKPDWKKLPQLFERLVLSS